MIERTAWPLIIAIGTLLLGASLTGQILRIGVAKRQAHALIDNLNRRINTWWVIVVVFVLALLAGPAAMTLLFALASLAALREFMSAGVLPGAPRGRVLAGMLLGVALQYLLAASGNSLLLALFMPVCTVLSQVLCRRRPAIVDDGGARWPTLVGGLLVCVYAVSHIPALLTLPTAGRPEHSNTCLLVFLVVVVQASDVLQYIWGNLAGRQQIAARISPGKTLAGTVGGILTASLLGACLSSLTPFTIGEAALVSLLITVLGFVGGLVLSAVKRQRGIKDWGRLLPGHGGMLDRLDSLWLPAPVFYYLLRYAWPL